MTSIVVDSSAVLALMRHEPGAAKVQSYIGDALISTVNLAEVLSKLHTFGFTMKSARDDFYGLYFAVADFTPDLAEDAAALILDTRSSGLSLGDRACLALARREGLPVLTADRAWKDLQVGVEIELIR